VCGGCGDDVLGPLGGVEGHEEGHHCEGDHGGMSHEVVFHGGALPGMELAEGLAVWVLGWDVFGEVQMSPRGSQAAVLY
jgi:hypothetical protein